MRGKTIIITGASGAGKSTLAEAAMKDPELNLEKVITCTTRRPREGEKDGEDYRFLSRERFEGLINKGAFFEYAEVYGDCYGSLKKDVEGLLESGKNVLFVVDVQGALSIKEKDPRSVSIFVEAPSRQELKKRLEKRGLDSEERMKERLALADKENMAAERFDEKVMNGKLETAKKELKRIILKHID